jgi:hypothetical protein
MMSPAEIAELVGELIEARMLADRQRLVDLIDGLLKGPVGDTLNVTLVLAGVLAEGAERPSEECPAIAVVHVDLDGSERPGSTLDLPPHVAIFVQMVAAIVAEDRDMARDLFIGYVGGDGRRALSLLAYALTEVAHNAVECDCAPNTIREESA